MLLVRKIDYSIQVFIGIMMIVSLPVLYLVGFLAGLFLLGCWQLVSAALNTRSYMTNGFRKQVNIYWKWTTLVLGILFLSIFLSRSSGSDTVLVPAWLAIAGSVPVAIYYLYIYNHMIAHMTRKRELGGLTKSKH